VSNARKYFTTFVTTFARSVASDVRKLSGSGPTLAATTPGIVSDELDQARQRIIALEAEVDGALGVIGYLAREAGELRIPHGALLENYQVTVTSDPSTDEQVYKARKAAGFDG
jgi:hypothetical protein